MVKLIEMVKEMLRIPIRTVCASLELAYSTYMRWKGRANRGEVLVKKPGPQKVPPLEVKGLMDNLLVTDSPPAGHSKLSEWAETNKDWLGKRYANELKRHYMEVDK